MTCRGFLACILKLCNFVMAMVGVALIVYSAWMLNEWNQHIHPAGPPPPPARDLTAEQVAGQEVRRALQSAFNFALKDAHLKFPAPWFIYGTLGAGIFTLITTCVGLLSAETHSACCLSFYNFLLGLLILCQATVAIAIFVDKTWQKDLPDDPTGDIQQTKAFIINNLNICKWLGVGIVIVEIAALLLALTLRAMQDGTRRGYESDDDYLPQRAVRRPLLIPQQMAAPPPLSEPRVAADAWSSRMREKYGLDTREFGYAPQDPRRLRP